MLGPTYFTSIWAVLYVGARAAVRPVRAALSGVAGRAHILDVDWHPLQAMGIAPAVVVTVLLAGVQWLA